jgi:hypothetical protein
MSLYVSSYRGTTLVAVVVWILSLMSHTVDESHGRLLPPVHQVQGDARRLKAILLQSYLLRMWPCCTVVVEPYSALLPR